MYSSTADTNKHTKIPRGPSRSCGERERKKKTDFRPAVKHFPLSETDNAIITGSEETAV